MPELNQTVLVTCRAEIEDRFSTNTAIKDNICSASGMKASSNPQLYAISFPKDKISYRLIKSSRVFAVNRMEKNHPNSAIPGDNIDKFKETGYRKTEAEKIDCPLIEDATEHIECEVINEIESGDHIIFIGHILRGGW